MTTLAGLHHKGGVLTALVQEPPLAVGRSISPRPERFAGYLRQMCESGRFSNFGPIHEALRDELRHLLCAERLGLFANATLALTIALRAHGVQRGEVITTPFSFAASVQAIEWADATPVYVDIDTHTMTIDPSAVEAAITPQTKAILAVHIYGIPCDVRALEQIARRHGIALIFDAAHAFDTRIEGIPVHRHGDATIYSTHASKLFHTGEGGILVCNDPARQLAAEQMSNFGFDGTGDAVYGGTNAKMSELHAALGLSILPEMDAERRARAELRRRYESALRALAGIRLVSIPHGVSDSLQYATIRVNYASNSNPALLRPKAPASSTERALRDAIHDCLLAHGIGSRKYFHPLCNAFSYQASRTGTSAPSVLNLTHACEAANTVLCLPFHSAINEQAVHAIASLIEQTISTP